MLSEFFTPKYLSAEMGKEVIAQVFDFVFGEGLSGILLPKNRQCHVVVVVPGKKKRLVDWEIVPGCALHPVVLVESSFGDPASFGWGYRRIAHSKALQLWEDRNDDRTDIVPHLLFSGESPYWGGVKRRGIVVACSGVQPHIDKLIAGMVADLLIAAVHDAWERSDDKRNDACFLE